MLSSQECQLVGVLANGWDTNSSGPIVIKMGLLVGVELQLIGIKPGLVPQNVVRRWRYGSLTNALRHQEKVISRNK